MLKLQDSSWDSPRRSPLGVALATTAQARDLTVVSWGGAYQDAQKKVYFEPFKKATGVADERRVLGRRHRRAARQGRGWRRHLGRRPGRERRARGGCDEGLFEKLDYSKIGGEADFCRRRQ